MPSMRAAAVVAAAVFALAAGAAQAEFPARKGLFVGTDYNHFDQTGKGKEVVQNGVQSSWKVADPYAVGDVVDYVDLYVSLDQAASEGNVTFPLHQNVSVSWQTDDIFEMLVYVEGEQLVLEEEIQISYGVQGQKRLHAVIDCTNRSTTGIGSVDLEIPDFQSLSLVFSYNCTDALDYAYGFDVSSAPSQEVDPDNQDALVINGRTIGDAHFFVPYDRQEAEFYAYLENMDPHGYDQNYSVALDTSEEIVVATVSNKDVIGFATNGGERTPVRLSFECNKDRKGPAVNASVTVTFVFEDNANHKNIEDAEFTFIKECATLSGGGGGGGWSAFGIFAFTVFIITLVFCVAGCAVNRFHFHKQGADIVPGMPLFRRLMGKDEGVYTPQADLEEVRPASGSASGSYGSYQDNESL